MTASMSTSFPKPVILKAVVAPATIYLPSQEDTPSLDCSSRFESVNVLYSSSGARYELGRVLKKAIYGVVLHATLLAPFTGTFSVAACQDPSSPSVHPSPTHNKVFTRTKVSFAVKIYSKEMIVSHAGRSKENPIQEIAAQQYLGDHHPNIMGQVECCADEIYVYSIMRFCPGGELFDHILTNGRLSEEEARKIFRQLIVGLKTFAEKGVGHLDISLENLLYNSTYQQIVIIDFGMSVRLLPAEDASPPSHSHFQPIRNNYCGKKNYMAPEIIASNDSVDALACDLWSAGICLLYILLGFPPLEVASPSDQRYMYVVSERLSALVKHWNLDISYGAIDLLQRILRVNPRDRISYDEILSHPWMNEVPPSNYSQLSLKIGSHCMEILAAKEEEMQEEFMEEMKSCSLATSPSTASLHENLAVGSGLSHSSPVVSVTRTFKDLLFRT